MLLCAMGIASLDLVPVGLAAAQLPDWPTEADLSDLTRRNLSQVCEWLKKEALEACLEYAQVGFDKTTLCKPWQQNVEVSCYASNGNCTYVGEELREFCRFALQSYFNKANAQAYIFSECRSTEDEFVKYRCPPASYAPLNASLCFTQEAGECMATCGVYGPCYCRVQRSTDNPDICDGETISKGPLPPVWDPYLQLAYSPGNYSCNTLGQPPQICRHHQPKGTCGMYKHCEPDLCVINNVTCPNRTECEAWGDCDPRQGWCTWTWKPDGAPCTDNVFYTLGDHCEEGVCVGTVDYCLKYNVTCVPESVCLRGGYCNPTSGRCVFDKFPDGEACDDGREYTVEDRCDQGVCFGKVVNLCIERGIVCEAPNSCWEPGVCDPLTGLCSDATPLSGKLCDDGSDYTVNETCINGICIGDPADAKFEFLTLSGRGLCTDRDGRQMGRYAGDVAEGEDECQEICLKDSQCLAYGYAYPLCMVYGTVRTEPPPDGRTWSYQLGTDPPAVSVEEVSPPVVGQRATVCRKKGFKPDTVDPNAKFMVDRDKWFGFMQIFLVSLAAVMLFFACPIMRCIGTFLCPGHFAPDLTEVEVIQEESVGRVNSMGSVRTEGSYGAHRFMNTGDQHFVLSQVLQDAEPPPQPPDVDEGGFAETPRSPPPWEPDEDERPREVQ